ncbi:MAG: hypothetical protein JOZ77_08875 [Candidatus Eremiobacteraeota bacterium]|nr:hypothetical protein [Candidatus Eremiobacteraeota bacterium]
MLLEHYSHAALARILTAAMLLFLGIFQIVAPRCFWGLSMYFKGAWGLSIGARRALDVSQRERLTRVLAARELAEGDAEARMRYVGAFTIMMAAVALFPAIPYVLPYALSCLAMAASVLTSYLHFRRATARRVAPLVRRSPWQSLPPIAMAATAICALGSAAFAIYPQFRVGSAIVVISTIALVAVAWRVALAPALLLGDDAQLEYLVDEHVRYCRVMGLVAQACAPPTVLVALAWATLPSNAHFFDGVMLIVALAFVAVMVMNLNPMRKRIGLA